MTCLDENQILDFVGGKLSASIQKEVLAHIDECDLCRQVVAQTAATMTRSCLSASTAPSPGISDATTETYPDQTGIILADRYRLIRLIGHGGSGLVYEALDLQLHVNVAIKVLHDEYAHEPMVINHLRREILASRKVNHPNVRRVFDLGISAGTYFISMELVDGITLNNFVERENCSDRTKLRLLIQIASAIAAAHQAGIIHRDLKPTNILVNSEEKVWVLDFALARGTTDRSKSTMLGAVGTPAYWAPEQAKGLDVTPAADVYSFGVLMLDVFGWRLSLKDTVEEALLRSPSPFRGILSKCLCEDPEDRLTASTLEAELRSIALKSKKKTAPKKILYATLGITLGFIVTFSMIRVTQKVPSILHKIDLKTEVTYPTIPSIETTSSSTSFSVLPEKSDVHVRSPLKPKEKPNKVDSNNNNKLLFKD